jgi:hypothetical protein
VDHRPRPFDDVEGDGDQAGGIRNAQLGALPFDGFFDVGVTGERFPFHEFVHDGSDDRGFRFRHGVNSARSALLYSFK